MGGAVSHWTRATMLMCSAPVYRDVVEDYKHPRRKKKEKKLGELPSYLRGSDSPNKSRREDLSGGQPFPAAGACVHLCACVSASFSLLAAPRERD